MTKLNIKRWLIGRPLKNEALNEERYSEAWGLPILASDALSSVAYAGEEILLVLIPAIGLLSYSKYGFITGAIIGLVIILALSYRQTIESYPNGGGAYIVAKENIGVMAGVSAGAALSVDYILTVSVSVSSGVAQITSAFASLKPYTVIICVGIIIFLMLGNLRGLKESAKLFSIPAYAFIFAIIAMLIGGIVKLSSGYVPATPSDIPAYTGSVGLFLLLRAFSNGCAAVTGIEAVSNAVPNFKEPSTHRANHVMALLAMLVVILFGGTSFLAIKFFAAPSEESTVIMQLAHTVFGSGIMYYFIMATTFLILVMASNTAYSGFPLLLSVISREGYAPRQLSMRGDRLSYSNGIIMLSTIAAALIIVFQADVSRLIGLYAIGVFISFTLSQTGMFLKWVRGKEKNWLHKAVINGFGAIVTAVVVVIIAITKFNEGAWIVVFLIPALVTIMLKVKKHYIAVSKQLRISNEEIVTIDLAHDTYKNRVIVPIASINRASIRAIRYAKTISDNVVAFNVSIDEEEGERLKKKYALLKTDIPLYVKYSPFRKVVDPLLKFIESEEYSYRKGDMITVILPQFSVKSWWHRYLHNQSRVYIEKQLLKHKHIVVATMPLQLKNDEDVLKQNSKEQY